MLRRCVPALLLLPLAGCLGGGPAASVSLFDLRGTIADDPTPLPMPGCGVLLEALNRRALDEARAALEQSVENPWGWYGRGDVLILEDTSSDAMAAESSTAGGAAGGAGGPGGAALRRQVTGTNNQEALADEGDLVKTDGTWTYVLGQDGTLHVLRHEGVGDVEEVTNLRLDGGWGGGHLLLEARDTDDPDDDRLVVVMPNAQPPADDVGLLAPAMRERAHSMARILVLDLEDRARPVVASDTFVEGHAAGVRLVDGVAHVVVQRWPAELGLRTWAEPEAADVRVAMLLAGGSHLPEGAAKDLRRSAAIKADEANRERINGLTLRDHLPLVLRVEDGRASPGPLGDPQCRDVLATPGPTGRAVSTILSLDVAGDLDSRSVQVLGASSVLYASGDALVLAAQTAESWWALAQTDVPESTDLHWFDLDGLDVTHRASGRVPGSILDSFALDVRGDRLRVATTVNTWSWIAREPMSSQVVVLAPLAGQLVPVGTVGGIAPTERIWSVRFTDERAYVVTFRNMDPLWVIDLAGDVPAILGELEIPGVSTYLHPIDDETLLAIGYGGGEDGLGLDWGNVQVSLFDLSDLSRPRRADVLDLIEGGGFSAAVDEHKAFTYWPEVGKLAVPVSHYDHHDGRAFGGLQLVDVDLARQRLSLAGAVNQSHLDLPEQDRYGYGSVYGMPHVERSFFMGDPPFGPVSVYAVSQRGVTAHDLKTLEPQGSVPFAWTEPTSYAID